MSQNLFRLRAVCGALDSGRILDDFCGQPKIKVMANTCTAKVDADSVAVQRVSEMGELEDKIKLNSKLTMMPQLPPRCYTYDRTIQGEISTPAKIAFKKYFFA